MVTLRGTLINGLILDWKDWNEAGNTLLYFKLQSKVNADDEWISDDFLEPTDREIELTNLEERGISIIRVVAVVQKS